MTCRRALLAIVVIAVISTAGAGDGVTADKVFRIGLLATGSASSFAVRVDAFRRGLREVGYVEGRNVTIEYRYTDGRPERVSALVNELVALRVDVIVTQTTPAVRAARDATRIIPIVMTSTADPVEAGFVASLARPGGNVTGVSNVAPDLDGKRLALIREALPHGTRVGVTWDPRNPGLVRRMKEMHVAAEALGIVLHPVEVRDAEQLDTSLVAAIKDGVGVLMVPTPIASVYARELAVIAASKRLPLVYDTPEFLDDGGGLMAYGPSFAEMYRRAAYFVDKILKGAKPAELPVEQPTKFELVINLKTAKLLRLTIPPLLLSRADHVIE